MMKSIESRYAAYLGARDGAGLKRTLATHRRDDARLISIGGRTLVNFAANDTLGLSFHPAVIERACAFARAFGAGAGASRLVSGNLEPFAAVENKVAALKSKEAALVLPTGFQANASVLAALLDRRVLGAEPLIFADRLNHASLHFGCAAAGARQIRYAHCDAGHLARLIEINQEHGRPNFILTESVFSMDGDVAPLDNLARIARERRACLIVDDAHATGLLGDKEAGLGGAADVVIGTFSKALGSFGAYVACSGVVKDYLVNACAGLIYTTAPAPSVLGAIDAALDLLPELDKERERVSAYADEVRGAAKSAGISTGCSATHIVPLITGDGAAALNLAAHLADEGYFAPAIRPPTVAKGAARVRVSVSAAHRREDVGGLCAALARACAKAA